MATADDGVVLAVQPRLRRKLRHEDFCLECGCSGELLMCEICPKVFHFECSGLADKDADFVCPWHACSACHADLRNAAAGAGFYCVQCTASHCAPCAAARGLTVATAHASPWAVPSAATFAALQRNGFHLTHPGDTLYVCSACQSDSDAHVVELLGLRADAALNVRRDVPLAHKKLVPPPDAPALPAAAAATDANGGSSSGGSGDGEEEAAAAALRAEAARAAAEVPAVRDFLAAGSASGPQAPAAMARRGWALLPQLRHAYVGRRARRFIPNVGRSDGTIVGHLLARHNEGMALWHCVHDDGDSEDLEEHEAEAAVEDFRLSVATASESKRLQARRKAARQKEREQATAAAASLRELGKSMPVECVGFLAPAAEASGGDAELVVLKRFRDAAEAAAAVLACWEAQGADPSDPGARDAAGAAYLATAAGRARLAEVKKRILRCCVGLEPVPRTGARARKGAAAAGKGRPPTLWGFRWRYALPVLPPEPDEGAATAGGSSSSSGRTEEEMEVDDDDHGGRRVRRGSSGGGPLTVAVPLTRAAEHALATGAPVPPAPPPLAATAPQSSHRKRQFGSGTGGVSHTQAVDVDVAAARRMRASPEVRALLSENNLRLADVGLDALVGAAAEHFGASDEEDEDGDSSGSEDGDDGHAEGADGGEEGPGAASPATRLWREAEEDHETTTLGKRARPAVGRPPKDAEQEGSALGDRKMPALGHEHQADVPAFSPTAAPQDSDDTISSSSSSSKGSSGGNGRKVAGSTVIWRPSEALTASGSGNGTGSWGEAALDEALRAAVAAQMQPGLVVPYLKQGDDGAVFPPPGSQRRVGVACVLQAPAPGASTVIATLTGADLVALPLAHVCPPVAADIVLQTLLENGGNAEAACASVKRLVTTHVLVRQWTAHEIYALLDAPALCSGRVRDLIRYMRQFRPNIKAAEVITLFLRFRRDHVLEVDDIYPKPAAASSSSSSSSAAALAEVEAYRDCLANPMNAQLAQSLKADFARERAGVVAVYRHADGLLAAHPGRKEWLQPPPAPAPDPAPAPAPAPPPKASTEQAKGGGAGRPPQAAASPALATGVPASLVLNKTASFAAHIAGPGAGPRAGPGPGPGQGGLLGDPAQHVAGRRRAAQAVSALSWDLPVNDRPPPLSVFEMEAFVRRFKHDPAVLPPALPPASSSGGTGTTEGGEGGENGRRSSEAAGRAASTGAVEVLQIDPTTDMVVGRFPSQSAAARATGAAQGQISACLRGVLKTSGGFKWRAAADADAAAGGGNP